MAGDLSPEYVLSQMEKGQLFPFYLFFGPNEFRLEKIVSRIREAFIPEAVRDFNFHLFYCNKGGKPSPADIVDTARLVPFISQNRLVIARRIENFSAKDLDNFLPYLDNPVESTCLIFVSSKTDFRAKFYNKIKKLNRAVNFKKLYDNQISLWIKKTAEELGFEIERDASLYLQQIVGNRLIDLYSELEKIYVRYGKTVVGMEEVKELAIYSRTYTIFELIDKISFRRGAESIAVLNRFLDEEGADVRVMLQIIGMINRQIGLLWQVKSVIKSGGHPADVAKKLHLPPFVVKNLINQSIQWRMEDLEKAVSLLYHADGLLKNDSYRQLVIENVLLSLCSRTPQDAVI